MLGKFQTDPLGRFGQYRQMNGTIYNVSVTYSSTGVGKKLKILSLLKIKSAKLREFHIKFLLIDKRRKLQ